MRLYHATLKSNLVSINEKGINPSFSKGKEACVWLHTRSRNEWAKLHTAKRYSVPIADIVIISVEIPRSSLTRRWRGIWTTTKTLSDSMREFDNDASWKKSFDSMFSAIKMRDCTPESILETMQRMPPLIKPTGRHHHRGTHTEYRRKR